MNTLVRWIQAFISMCARIPYSLIALVARFSIAAVFWKSGQTSRAWRSTSSKAFNLGWPRLADSAVALFRDEYKVPLIPPELRQACARRST
jgi:putative oxidoreductase